MRARSLSAWLGMALVLLLPPQLAMTDTDTSPTPDPTPRAIGTMEGLPAYLRRAFEDNRHFDPLPPPGPGDWLAQHPEPGQTFDQFLRAPHPRPDVRRHRLYLLPLGDFPPGRSPSLDRLRAFTAAFFALEVRLLPAVDLDAADIAERRNPHTGQRQLDARDILRRLRRQLPADAFALLGISMVDLYPDPAWNFVFGLAAPADRVGVFSFARYDPRFYGEAVSEDTEALVLRRGCKVLAHEIGHMFGLAHCTAFHCLMNGSNHLAESDARPLHLCPVDLRKLQHSVGFDPVARYRQLLQLSRNAGFDDEAEWLQRRLRYLEGTPE